MSHLTSYPLPYTASSPPAELARPVETESGRSDTTAFNTGLDERDQFLGEKLCIVCGHGSSLQHCYIVPRSNLREWAHLQQVGWIPAGAKASPEHEPRNGLTMCPNHHIAFDALIFFIRYEPKLGKYIFVHFDSYGAFSDEQFHGKAVALDPKDKRSPLPLLLLVHEYMVRGKNFLQPSPAVPISGHWQEWMLTSGVVNEAEDGGESFTFKREAPPQPSGPHQGLHALSANRYSPSPDTAPESGPQLFLSAPQPELIGQLMSTQRTMPSWKAWQTETMSWEGTTEENTQRYVENVGVEDDGGGESDHKG